MASTCRPFGRWAICNYFWNYEAWKRSCDDAAPHGRFCGYLAFLQIELGGFFVNEQPEASWLFSEPSWPDVLESPGVDCVIFDQCQFSGANL